MKTKKLLHAYEDPEFMRSREARIIRILSEYLEPEKRYRNMNIEHTVVVFGSARVHPDSPDEKGTSRYYHAAADFAFHLAQLSKEIENETGSLFYICTGGGPGIMEAANMGAARAGLPTIGLNIDIPLEQVPNKYITPGLSFNFHYFFMRKLWFLYQAKAVVIFPGGFGTLDEMFETFTLVQTRKLEKVTIPILLYDKDFWNSLINFEQLIQYGFIDEEDLNLFYYFSSIEEGIAILRPRIIELIKNVNLYLKMKFPI